MGNSEGIAKTYFKESDTPDNSKTLEGAYNAVGAPRGESLASAWMFIGQEVEVRVKHNFSRGNEFANADDYRKVGTANRPEVPQLATWGGRPISKTRPGTGNNGVQS